MGSGAEAPRYKIDTKSRRGGRIGLADVEEIDELPASFMRWLYAGFAAGCRLYGLEMAWGVVWFRAF